MPHQKCSWPNCAEESDRPFADGWSSYGAAEDALPGLPAHGFLCPVHKLAFEALAVDEQPPTASEH
jgi:hypothetical protein